MHTGPMWSCSPKRLEQIAPLIAGLQLVLKEPRNNNDVDGDGFNDDVDLCPVDTSDENTESACLGSGFDDPCGNGETCTVMLASVQDGYDSACTGFTQNPCTAGDPCPEAGATCAYVPIGNGTYDNRCVHLCEDVPPLMTVSALSLSLVTWASPCKRVTAMFAQVSTPPTPVTWMLIAVKAKIVLRFHTTVLTKIIVRNTAKKALVVTVWIA